MSKASEVDDLIRDIKATGTHNVSSIGAHHKVTDSDGNVVYVLAKTPSDRRWRDNAVRGLVKAGVFEKDPRKNNGHPKKRSNLHDPEVQAKKVAAVKARHERFAAATREIRARIDPLIVKVGGWGSRKGQVSASELGLAAMHWGRNRPDVFASEEGARSSAQSNIKQGGTLSEKGASFWDAFVTAWESADDPRRWYFDLVREMKGLPKTSVIVGGAEVAQTTGKRPRTGPVHVYKIEEEEEPEEKLENGKQPEVIGRLALKAVLLMASGSETMNHQEILELGEQILALETRATEEKS